MRCGCPVCGIYMVQREGGLGCACPNCLHACADCMGGGEPPASKDELNGIYTRRKIWQEYEGEK